MTIYQQKRKKKTWSHDFLEQILAWHVNHILDMRKFNYVMISPYMVKRLRHGGENLNFPHQIWSKDYVTGVKTLRNQTYPYQE